MSSGQGVAASLAGLLALLVVLAATVGLDPLAVVVGLVCGAALGAALVRGLALEGSSVLGPADLVTLLRATLACGLAALVAESFLTSVEVTAVVALAALALALDAVDGRVARRTGTTSAFGARFDGEADAFLLLVLSVYVARSAGAWVLAIGAARYVFWAAGWAWPWMRDRLPFRYWRKVVTAVQGIVLCVTAADVLPPGPRDAVLALALTLLAESFGRDVLWLWRHRSSPHTTRTGPATHASAP